MSYSFDQWWSTFIANWASESTPAVPLNETTNETDQPQWWTATASVQHSLLTTDWRTTVLTSFPIVHALRHLVLLVLYEGNSKNVDLSILRNISFSPCLSKRRRTFLCSMFIRKWMVNIVSCISTFLESIEWALRKKCDNAIISSSRWNECSPRTSGSILHLNTLHHCSASGYFLCSLDEIFCYVTVPINFNSFINEITMYVDEYIAVRSIILSTLSYQTLVIRTSLIVQQLIKTSSTRLDQFDFMRCLMISTSFFFSFVSCTGKRIWSASVVQPYRLSKIRSTCLYLSFYSCSEQCQRYAYAYVCVYLEQQPSEKRNESFLCSRSFFHLSRLLLVRWVQMYADALVQFISAHVATIIHLFEQEGRRTERHL